MKRMISLSIAAILCASQVSALSCMRPDPARAFNQAAAAEDSYLVVLGQFSFRAPPAQRPDPQNPPSEQTVQAQFQGQFLGVDGFDGRADLDVTLNFTCASVWCGSIAPNAGTVLAFVEQTPAGYILEVGPCQGNVFTRPTREDIQVVEACMRGEGCQEGDWRR